ncbi:MAG: GIY-YIG nuclease family protein [Candidatus Giovannonibacteria bacterium]|nr:MAG: GIY-YIG nuclease family protein [Candidatus Giovannonibacteria bacterium]
MFKIYIIQSLVNDRYYIGHTEDINKRVAKHNAGEVKSTKYGKPWKIIHLEEYSSRSEAYQRELEIKSYKGGIKFKKLLGLWKGG